MISYLNESTEIEYRAKMKHSSSYKYDLRLQTIKSLICIKFLDGILLSKKIKKDR